MTITHNCEECGKDYELADAAGGKLIRCKACGATMRVPEASTTPSDQPSVDGGYEVIDDDDFEDYEDYGASADEVPVRPLPNPTRRSSAPSRRSSGSGDGGKTAKKVIAGVCGVISFIVFFMLAKGGVGLLLGNGALTFNQRIVQANADLNKASQEFGRVLESEVVKPRPTPGVLRSAHEKLTQEFERVDAEMDSLSVPDCPHGQELYDAHQQFLNNQGGMLTKEIGELVGLIERQDMDPQQKAMRIMQIAQSMQQRENNDLRSLQAVQRKFAAANKIKLDFPPGSPMGPPPVADFPTDMPSMPPVASFPGDMGSPPQSPPGTTIDPAQQQAAMEELQRKAQEQSAAALRDAQQQIAARQAAALEGQAESRRQQQALLKEAQANLDKMSAEQREVFEAVMAKAQADLAASSNPQTNKTSATTKEGSGAPIQPTGIPVTSAMKLTPGMKVEAESSGKWYTATVLGLPTGSEIRIHWDGWGAQWDGPVPLSRLRIDPQTVGQTVVASSQPANQPTAPEKTEQRPPTQPPKTVRPSKPDDPAEVAAALKALKSISPSARQRALEDAGNLQSAELAEAIAKHLGAPIDRVAASRSLKKMGPIAEKFVTPYLRHDEAILRSEAVRILREIGTTASIPALEALMADTDIRTRKLTEQAIQEIKTRGE